MRGRPIDLTVSAAVEVRCPGCSSVRVSRIGALPDANSFAGEVLSRPLPESNLYDCHECTLRFRYPLMTMLEYNSMYNNNQIQTWDADLPRNDWDLLVDWLPRNLPAQSKVLDFGCYTGGLLEKLGPRYQRFGIEVNARARSVASSRTDAEVFPGLEGVPASMKFNAILAVDVIEHFEAPGKVMALLLDMLENEGVLIISTGDGESWLWNLFGARWWYCFFPEHLAFISERWARQWLQMTRGGVHLESVKRFRHVHLSVLRYINQVILAFIYFLMPRAYLRFVPRLKRLLGRSAIVHPPGAGLTRDHIFLVIRKSGVTA